MMWFNRLLIGLLLLGSPAAAQTGPQFGAGQIWGNSTSAQRPGRVESLTAILDRALGSTRGALIERGASAWGLLSPSATARVPYLSGGTGADPIFGAYTLPASVTSGGVACFTSTTVQASSALLTANAIILGGGAGVCPAPMGSLGTTTTVLHGNAAGAPTFAAIVSADLNITATNCTNQFVSAISTGGVGTCNSVSFAAIASAAIATCPQLAAATASTLVASANTYCAETTTTFGATTTFDFSTFINTNVTLTANITTQSVSNVKAGQAGMISFTQSGAGSFTTVWNSIFKWAAGTAPVLTTGSTTAVDVLAYSCRSATFCAASLIKDVR